VCAKRFIYGRRVNSSVYSEDQYLPYTVGVFENLTDMQCLMGIHMVSRSEVVMVRAFFSGSVLTIALLTGVGFPAIARAGDPPLPAARNVDVRDRQRLKLVPSLRLEAILVRGRAPVRSFGLATPEDAGLGRSVLRGAGTLDVDDSSQAPVGSSWRAIGSVTLPWCLIRLGVGYGLDGALSLTL
jgi:hypothetical protein